MLNFIDAAKAQVTQSLTAVLLEAAGYRVSRFGVEEVLGPIKHLDADQYSRLNLPHQLRFLPDLLISEADLSSATMLEVKFRARFDERTARGLHEKLSRQLELWPGTLVALFVGRSSGRGYIQDHLRVVMASNLNLLVDPSKAIGARWESLRMLHDAFPRLNSSGYHSEADRITTTIAMLAEM